MDANILIGALVGTLLVVVLVVLWRRAQRRAMENSIAEIDRLAEAGYGDSIELAERIGRARKHVKNEGFNVNEPPTRNMRPPVPPKAPPPAPAKRVRHDHYVHDGRVDRTQQPGHGGVPGSTHQHVHYDPLHPANPISPISPFNPMNQVHDEPAPERRRDPDPSPSYDPPSSDYGGSSGGGSSSDSGSSSSSD